MTAPRASRVGWLVAVLALALGAAVAPSQAGGERRPDLVVRGGPVTLDAGRLEGELTVAVRGRGTAPRSTTVLTLTGAGAPRPLASYAVRRVRPGAARTVAVAATLPAGLPAGTWTVTACADGTQRVRERRERNNCRAVGTFTTTAPTGPPTSTVPTAPIAFPRGVPFRVGASSGDYWAYVPTAYDGSHQTPTRVLVWMHGCGGTAKDDAWSVSPGGAQDWVTVSVGGRDGGCWSVPGDATKVLAALDDLRTHFNVDPRRVVVGGYSSGGLLAYQTAFRNAWRFAGVLVENAAPFYGTGSSPAESLAAAGWRFPVRHLAHTGDDVFPLATVRSELAATRDAGHPVTLVERPGAHWDPQTVSDLRTYLLPAMAGWVAPG